MVVERGHEFVNVGEKDIQYVLIDSEEKVKKKETIKLVQMIENAKQFFVYKIHDFAVSVKTFFTDIPEFTVYFVSEIKNDVLGFLHKVKSLF